MTEAVPIFGDDRLRRDVEIHHVLPYFLFFVLHVTNYFCRSLGFLLISWAFLRSMNRSGYPLVVVVSKTMLGILE